MVGNVEECFVFEFGGNCVLDFIICFYIDRGGCFVVYNDLIVMYEGLC